MHRRPSLTGNVLNTHSLFDSVEAGRRLGHDLFQYRRSLDETRVAASVQEGFAEARLRRVSTRSPDRFVRKWLQLRLSAQRRGRVVTDDITPQLLRRIDVETCPVIRCRLTHGELGDADGSVDRLNNDGAYAANNLAVMSTRANRAKGDRSFDAVLALSQRREPTDGLTPIEWSRLAALMLGPCFATRLADAPILAMNVPVARYAALTGAQMIQHVLTTQAARPPGKNLLIKRWKAACRDERARTRLCALVDGVHLGLKTADPPCDVWLRPALLNDLVEWRQALGSEHRWAMAIEIARVLANGGHVPLSRIGSWQLETRGYAC